MLIYIIKQTKQYNKQLFDLKEDEKEGTLDFGNLQIFRNRIVNKDYGIIKLLFEEKNELLIMLLVILSNNSIEFTKKFYYQIVYKIYDECKENDKIEDLLNILCSLAKINDKYSFERLYNVMGYPNIIIKNIPRKKTKKKEKQRRYYGHQTYIRPGSGFLHPVHKHILFFFLFPSIAECLSRRYLSWFQFLTILFYTNKKDVIY